MSKVVYRLKSPKIATKNGEKIVPKIGQKVNILDFGHGFFSPKKNILNTVTHLLYMLLF